MIKVQIADIRKTKAPILDHCRELIESGGDPNETLDVYRGEVLALRVKGIGRGAKLTIQEQANGSGVRLVRWRPFGFDAGSPGKA